MQDSPHPITVGNVSHLPAPGEECTYPTYFTAAQESAFSGPNGPQLTCDVNFLGVRLGLPATNTSFFKWGSMGVPIGINAAASRRKFSFLREAIVRSIQRPDSTDTWLLSTLFCIEETYKCELPMPKLFYLSAIPWGELTFDREKFDDLLRFSRLKWTGHGRFAGLNMNHSGLPWWFEVSNVCGVKATRAKHLSVTTHNRMVFGHFAAQIMNLKKQSVAPQWPINVVVGGSALFGLAIAAALVKGASVFINHNNDDDSSQKDDGILVGVANTVGFWVDTSEKHKRFEEESAAQVNTKPRAT